MATAVADAVAGADSLASNLSIAVGGRNIFLFERAARARPSARERARRAARARRKMDVHIVVLHIVACRSSEGRVLAESASKLQLTVRLYYRVGAQNAWEDVVIVAEGRCSAIDAFVSAVKSRDGTRDGDEDAPAHVRGVSLILRQWGYVLPTEQPTERAAWGYKEWMEEAERELREHADGLALERSDEDGRGDDAASAGELEQRHLGPPGMKGAAYKSWDELISQRLEKLGLGCSWDDVVLAAQLNSAMSQRSVEVDGADAGQAPKKRGRRDGAGASETRATNLDGQMQDLSVEGEGGSA